MARIGFIGAGYMGHGMAGCLLRDGHEVRLLAHRNRAPIEDLLARGASEGASPRDLAAWAEAVVLVLPNSAVVEATLRGPEGLLVGAREGLMILDCTTSDPISTTQLAAEAAARGVTLIDAPLGRTPVQAAEGTLDVMMGAPDDAAFARASTIANSFAGKIVRCGPVGAGHRMKLINNFLSLGYGALYAEAITMGLKGGIPPAVLREVLEGGRMSCGFMETFFKGALGRDPEAHKFSIANAAKDLRYASSFATAAGMANPLGAAALNSYAAAVAQGHGDDFIPTLADRVAEWNGADLPAATERQT